MFRRALLLLLVLLLPLKVAAASVVSLVGMPGHAHVQTVDDQFAASSHSDHAGCQQEEAPSSPVHDHACPHLGMVSIATFAPIIDLQHAIAPLNSPPAPHFSPVVPDVPSPIPLAFSAR